MHKTTTLKIKTYVERVWQIGKVVTGLYNVANYERRKTWRNTGIIPTYYHQYYSLRKHPLAKLLHSHVTQQILITLDQNYPSFLKS